MVYLLVSFTIIFLFMLYWKIALTQTRDQNDIVYAG